MATTAVDLEQLVPGFRACFGGEELRRAQAAMSCLLVGGTIQALVPSDLPPSLARQATTVMRARSGDGASPAGITTKRSLSMPSHSAAAAAADSVAGRAPDPTPSGAILELEYLASSYTQDLERLGVEAPEGVQGPGSTAMGDPQCSSAAYEAAYGLGLVLQDLAARSAAGSTQHMQRLREACEKYALAARLRPGAHSALYNWGVALSDLARAVRPSDPSGAKKCLEAAASRYTQALAAKPDTPQALNNWGLVLQELSGLARSRVERDTLLRQACAKFRQAIRMRPDFDRGCYNLGTVCYAAACLLQAELGQPPAGAGRDSAAGEAGSGSASPGLGSAGHASLSSRAERDAEVQGLFASAAQYICLAYALQQHKDIYKKSLGVVRRLLPLPFLRAGFLMTPLPSTAGTPEEAWRQDWFVLDASSLRTATGVESSLSVQGSTAAPLTVPSGGTSGVVIPLQQIAAVQRVRDPTLPKGEAFCVVLHGAHTAAGQEVCMVAEDEESADVWVDILQLAAYVVQTRSAQQMAEALSPAAQ